MAHIRNRPNDIKGQGTTPCPFTIQVDTREQMPYVFSNMKTNKDKGEKRIIVKTERLCLPDGDYSILGMSDRILVERKSKEDLYGSVGRRANFKGRLERMSALASLGGYAAVIVECEQAELMNRPDFSRLSARSLSRTLIAWRMRYRVDWFFVPHREWGEAYTFRILERFYLREKKKDKE